MQQTRITARTNVALFLLATTGIAALACASIAQSPGDAASVKTAAKPGAMVLSNNNIRAVVSVQGGRLRDVEISDGSGHPVLPPFDPFGLILSNGATYRASELEVTHEPEFHNLSPQSSASRLAETLPGTEIVIALQSPDHSMHVRWSLELRQGSRYIRQKLTITAASSDLPITRVQLADLEIPNAQVSGTVHGSPIIAGNLFAGFEHPLSQSKAKGGRAFAWIDRELPLRKRQSITYSSVIGLARQGQMRRDFLEYLERERAHPYRTFLHYNSWYDLGYFTPYDAASAVDRINTFGRELVQKRSVKIDSYLFDDGWDNHHSLWGFNPGFPEGFTPLKEAAAKYNASPGVWLSPWGGYSTPKNERIEFARQTGYEVISGGYALSGPKYYSAFRNVCLDMVNKYGVNQFKIDGTGNVDSVFPGSTFDSDFSAAIQLIEELRAAKPDLFVNLTTGTWPSPFWLMYADSIWRGGDDDSVAGVGSYRERWITYRDADTYKGIVLNGPLYPLNSLMLHGIIYAQHHKDLNTDPGNDFRNEVRSYFGTGTQLQEMYITPSLLSARNWDDLSEAAKWSRDNAEVLRDTHWIGGDPAWLEVYGWAAWTSAKGTLVLRNPSDQPRTFRIKLQDAFELPADAPRAYIARSPWKDDALVPPIQLTASEPHEFRLAPFEVLTLDINRR